MTLNATERNEKPGHMTPPPTDADLDSTCSYDRRQMADECALSRGGALLSERPELVSR